MGDRDIGRERWSAAFAELADAECEQFDVAGRLSRLARWCCDLLAVPAVAVLLVGRGNLLRVAASAGLPPESATLLVLAQYTGAAPVCRRTAGRTRITDWWGWPAVRALPMRGRGNCVGCVLIFEEAGLAESDVDVAQALADVAALGVLQYRAFREWKVLVGQLQTALDSRIVIEQAKGVLAGGAGIGMDAAFESLRGATRRTRRRMDELAREVVTSGRLPRSAAPIRHRGKFAHPALFYRSDEEYVETALPFIREGLRAGEPVAVAVPGAKLRLLRNGLGADPGDVQWADMTRGGRNPGWIIPGILRAFADRHRGRRIRIIGEPVWPSRTRTEYPACVQHEALINLAFGGRDATILCPYDITALPSHAVADAAVTHPVLLAAGQETRSATFSPQRALTKYNRPLPEPGETAAETFDGSTLGHACGRIAELAMGTGLRPDRVRDLDAAVVELALNSIAHGGGSGALRLWHDRTHIIAEVADRGHVRDPLAGRRPGGKSSSGLLTVNRLADLVRMHTTAHGTTIRVYFHR